MNLHDRADRFERLTYLLVLEAELRYIAAERARRTRWRTITIAADGTARLPSDWQTCVEPVGSTPAFKRRWRTAGCNSGNLGLAGE